jgi:hypothetical protein
MVQRKHCSLKQVANVLDLSKQQSLATQAGDMLDLTKKTG